MCETLHAAELYSQGPDPEFNRSHDWTAFPSSPSNLPPPGWIIKLLAKKKKKKKKIGLFTRGRKTGQSIFLLRDIYCILKPACDSCAAVVYVLQFRLWWKTQSEKGGRIIIAGRLFGATAGSQGHYLEFHISFSFCCAAERNGGNVHFRQYFNVNVHSGVPEQGTYSL